MKTLDINKYLESSLNKLIISKNGDILGMTNVFKNLVNEKELPNHISEIFDDLLYKKIRIILECNQDLQTKVQESLIGNLKISDGHNASCYITYEPDSEKAIITVNLYEQQESWSKLYENTFFACTTPLAILNEWGFFVSVNDAFCNEFHFPSKSNGIHLKTFLEGFQCEENFSFDDYFLRIKNETFLQTKISSQVLGETTNYNLLLQLDPKTELFLLKIVETTEQERLLDLLARSDQLSTTGEIAASIAHEVRNPMTTLQGFLQLLEHEVIGNAQKYVKVIQEEVKHMNSILDEMLSLSKPVVDKVTIFSLPELVEEVLILLRPKALLDQINLVNEILVTEPVLIKANPKRMKQVLVNLLKNAMEAMESEGTLGVQICASTDSIVDICISDTGIGMSEDMLEKIFLPFISEKEGGTGLGLPFVKKTITEYGGTISVRSEVGKGSVFQLGLPRIDSSLLEIKS
ncbi:ATP-binding protein [Sporosarcina sp. GW1-11]|uniref:ATP-binding protein n=1 Tax=Sporosarcina sp. GW1-11 TaxID=2899126 RepID=UPI00294EFF31|nr:ATP-binding protein [Sporosarcina sp. GW1-11]MDV6379195.1 ATP-binding protein [Sporosarcina sp. GW1-11]